MKLFHHEKETPMADISAAVAAWQTARDAFNQASDDLASAVQAAASDDQPLKDAAEAAFQALAPFAAPPA